MSEHVQFWQLPLQLGSRCTCMPWGADSACSGRQLLGSRSLQPTRLIRIVVIDDALRVTSRGICLCALLLPYAVVLVHRGPAMGHANSKQLNQAGTSILQAIREGDELTFLQVLPVCCTFLQPLLYLRIVAWSFFMHVAESKVLLTAVAWRRPPLLVGEHRGKLGVALVSW